MEDASGEGEQECWFESSEMESGSWADYCQSGVNLAIPVYREYCKPGSKLDDDDVQEMFLFSRALEENFKIPGVASTMIVFKIISIRKTLS